MEAATAAAVGSKPDGGGVERADSVCSGTGPGPLVVSSILSEGTLRLDLIINTKI